MAPRAPQYSEWSIAIGTVLYGRTHCLAPDPSCGFRMGAKNRLQSSPKTLVFLMYDPDSAGILQRR